jgi:hypothetical protein
LADASRDFEWEVSANEWPESLDESIELLLEIEKKLNRERQETWEILRDSRWDLMVQRAETEASRRCSRLRQCAGSAELLPPGAGPPRRGGL